MSIPSIDMIAIKEQLTKRVVSSGNGGAVWVPKSWLGEEIIVIRPEKNIKQQIIELLLPNLQDVIAIFLYGSYARDEQTQDSDIDVLVIAKNKFNIKKQDKLDIKVIGLEKLKQTIKKNPIMYLSIIKEAKAILNSPLLNELKKLEIKKNNFKWFIETTLDSIKSDENLIELDNIEGEYISSYSAIYSIILRLRGIFLIKCLLDKKDYSNKLFKQWLLKHEISKIEYEIVYNIYKSVRDDKKTNNKIKISVAESLLNILKKEINNLKVKLYGK